MRTERITFKCWFCVAIGITLSCSTSWAKKPVKPPEPEPQCKFNIINLGTYPGAVTYGRQVNDAGLAAGEIYYDFGWRIPFVVVPKDADGDGHPDTWYEDVDQDGVNDLMRDAGHLTGDGTQTVFWRMNNYGQLVGGSQVWSESKNTLVSHAFIVTPDGYTWFQSNGTGGNSLMTDLGSLRGADFDSGALGVNDLGQVVGNSKSEYNPYKDNHGFLVNPVTDQDGNPITWFKDDNGDGINDCMIDLGVPDGDLHSGALAINNSSWVMGNSGGEHIYVIIPEVIDGVLRWYDGAADRSANSLMTVLPALEGGRETMAWDIGAVSDDGHCAVPGQCRDSSGALHAVVWDVVLHPDGSVTTAIQDLGQTVARSLNSQGTIVGYGVRSSRNRIDYWAMLWERGSATKLERVLVDNGGFKDLWFALDINEFSEIAGTGIVDGQRRAFIAVPVP